MSAAASLGLSLLWDTDVGLSHVDKYTYSTEEYIKVLARFMLIFYYVFDSSEPQAGAYLATGILNCGVRTEADAAFALLSEHVESKSVPLKTGAIMGLGLAYVGSQREDVSAHLLALLTDDSNSIEIISLAALALGFINVGSCNGDVTSSILLVFLS